MDPADYPPENTMSMTKYLVDDGHCSVVIEAASSEEAARQYVEDGWDPSTVTEWYTVHVFDLVALRAAHEECDADCEWDGDEEEAGYCDQSWDYSETNRVDVDPVEPACSSDEGHDWQQHGVRGNGGGVIVDEVCVHCGRGRRTDTWAQDPSDGAQGLTSISYLDAEE